MHALLLGIGCWTAVSVALGVLIGQAIRLADELPPEPDDLTALIQPESWSQAEFDAEFDALVPLMSTERRREWFA